MLVLSLKVGERIAIGDGVELAVVAINGSRVRLGIVAPREITVRRSKLRDNRVKPLQCQPERGVKVA